ncbi:WbqC family protein [Winogradskyella bathintestinalis]|uniref:WbqC family protein n=1 Tax=Winogradskyella bathintestinalis TaxID=3035208 RepID=A0ABT7ZTV8_9FLAO|nr:WbqC family protein [Winogradskyella bathintestinalis]MDN3492435.1 WbqC family protein [Winogradskyella bathintestinalis]
MKNKKIAVMQPYFLPYLGYFQLINSVDEFVIYDNIQFTKRGWFHRNRILEGGKPKYITLPLKKDSDYLHVKDRFLADDFEKHKNKILARIQNAYCKAPYYDNVFPVIEKLMSYNSNNLFEFNLNSIRILCDVLKIDTKIRISSSIDIDHGLKSEKKVIALCKALEANHYINPEGGIQLYRKEDFEIYNISLSFLKFKPTLYQQNIPDFQSHLSIIDVLMFNSSDEVNEFLFKDYEIV